MRISDIYTSKYFKATDVPSTGVTYVIERGFREEMNKTTPDGEKIYKPAVKFKGLRKLLILNATNADIIKSSYGDEMDHWAGKSLTLRLEPTRYQGRPTKGIRVSCEAFDDDVDDAPGLGKAGKG
jgi:hypothetical protein